MLATHIISDTLLQLHYTFDCVTFVTAGLLSVLYVCCIAMALHPPFDIIFLGNPGTGKSTLLSCISGLRFESGVSFGAGLTQKLIFQTSPHLPGIRFGDTPGLADVAMAKNAALQINEALNDAAESGRVVKLFFVVTTESGRLRGEDLFTIEQVMQSVKLPDGKVLGPNSYGIIVNKCGWLRAHPEGKDAINAFMSVKKDSVPFVTSYNMYLPFLQDLQDASNVQVHFEDLPKWVYSFPGIDICGATLIDTRSVNERLAEMKRNAEKDFDKVKQTLANQHSREMKELRGEMDRTCQDLQHKLEKSKSANIWASIMGAVLAVILQQVPRATEFLESKFAKL